MGEQSDIEPCISYEIDDELHHKARIGCRKRVFFFKLQQNVQFTLVEKQLLDMKGSIR